jgi:hypothetical protein
MHDESNVPGPEFKVRSVTRYVVTRYFYPYKKADALGGVVEGYSEVLAEVPTEEKAIEIAQCMVTASAAIGATLSL